MSRTPRSAASAESSIEKAASPQTTCPRGVYAWLDDASPWPLETVRLGAASYERDFLEAMIDDEALEEDDASVALAAELLAAKLNRAAGATTWEPLDSMIDEADAALDGELPLGIASDTSAAETPLQLA